MKWVTRYTIKGKYLINTSHGYAVIHEEDEIEWYIGNLSQITKDDCLPHKYPYFKYLIKYAHRYKGEIIFKELPNLYAKYQTYKENQKRSIQTCQEESEGKI